jgi:hypothetical protein
MNATSQQLAVIGALMGGELSGRELRAELERREVTMKRPAFYRQMARAEDAGLVKGRTAVTDYNGVPITERFYEVTGVGRSAWNEAMMNFGLAGGV